MIIVDIALFVIVIALTGVAYPVIGLRQAKKARKGIGFAGRAEWYTISIISSWIPAIIIFAATIANGHSPQELGFIRPSIINGSLLFFYIALFLSGLYMLYNICTIILLKYNRNFREKHSINIPLSYRSILPTNKKERRIWQMLAITAGITEEVIYRGYMFFALQLIFPEISAVLLIIIPSVIFSFGHIYQKKEAWKPALAGIFLSLVYYFTGSLYIVIALHIVQDLVAGELEPHGNKCQNILYHEEEPAESESNKEDNHD